MLTLGAKTSQWHPGHVPYLPYPRYATVSVCSIFSGTRTANPQGHEFVPEWSSCNSIFIFRYTVL